MTPLVPTLTVVWPPAALEDVVEKATGRSAIVVAVQSATEFRRIFIASGLANRIASFEVGLVALVGAEAEHAHDVLDGALEELGREDILTSWHAEGEADDVASLVVALTRTAKMGQVLAVLDASRRSGREIRDQIAHALHEWQ
jgi:hypothetical protein